MPSKLSRLSRALRLGLVASASGLLFGSFGCSSGIETNTPSSRLGCKVNGTPWMPVRRWGGFPSPQVNAGLIRSGLCDFSVVASRESDNPASVLEIAAMLQGRVAKYKLGQAPDGYGNFSMGDTQNYLSDSTSGGELTITAADSNHTAGTFWFNAVAHGGDTVRITDGYFDLAFSIYVQK